MKRGRNCRRLTTIKTKKMTMTTKTSAQQQNKGTEPPPTPPTATDKTTTKLLPVGRNTPPPNNIENANNATHYHQHHQPLPSTFLVPPCPPNKTNTKRVYHLPGCTTSHGARSVVNCRMKGDRAEFLDQHRSSPPFSFVCIPTLQFFNFQKSQYYREYISCQGMLIHPLSSVFRTNTYSARMWITYPRKTNLTFLLRIDHTFLTYFYYYIKMVYLLSS